MKKYIHLFFSVCLIVMMTISSFASEVHIYDETGILAQEELADLNREAASVSEKYGYGIYAIIVNDYQRYGTGDIFTTAAELYHGLSLGKGENREGILLMLSMDDRDYATFFYGKNVEYAFNEYGQIQLEDQFLDDFADNDWYDGFEDYITVCDEYLGLATAGNPVRESHASTFIMVIGASVVLAFVVTYGLKVTMKSVHRGGSAAPYATEGGLQLTARGDYFLYNTQTRRKIERSSNRSGSRSRSGGGSGRSGKF